MNVLLVTAMFPPIRTGTAFYARNLAQALARAGNGVTVVTIEDSDAPPPESGVAIRRLRALSVPLRGFFKHLRLTALFPSNYARVLRAARETGAEAILLVNHYLDIAFPAIYAARMARLPLACSVGTQLQSLNPRRDRVLNMFDRLICGWLVFPFCDRVIAWDTQILKYLADVHGGAVTWKTVIVNYGVNGDPSVFLQHQHDYSLHNQLLGVGAVSEQRSFVPLVRAFALLAREFPELRLKIVGYVYYDKAVRMAAELGIADRVEFTGEQPHAEVLAEMQHSDAFYSSLTGRYLGLGTATIESMLMGLPTVANAPLDLLGTAMLEDMRHLVHGPDTDPEAIAAKVGALLRDRDLRARIGAAGRRFVLEHMNWDKVARDMERALAGMREGAAC